MKRLFLLILLLVSGATWGQIDMQQHDFCGHVGETFNNNSKMPSLSTNGLTFTPRGDLRALVVYVNFTPESIVPAGGETYDIVNWPKTSEFPEYSGVSEVDLQTGEISWAHDDIGDFSPLGNPAPDAAQNISEFFYHMSNGEFRFYAETLKDPLTGLPKSVVIDPIGLISRSQVVGEVFNQINQNFSNFNWSRFDLKDGIPNWDEDESDTCFGNGCDNRIDFVFLVFRNDNSWNPHPNGSTGTGWSAGVASLPGAGNSGYSLNSTYSTGPASRSGFVSFLFWNQFYQRLNNYIHEIAHTYYNSSHRILANLTHGDYLYADYGWGMMDGYGVISMANAWDRWYSGWIDITHDVDESASSSTIYNLRDYLRYGESMRVKLPHSADEYIWLENHLENNTNTFYKRWVSLIDGDGDPIPFPTPGLHGYVEHIAGDLSEINTFFNGSNGIKMLNGEGSFDYVFGDVAPRSYLGGGIGLNVLKESENAYNGQHSGSFFRYDLNDDQMIEYDSGVDGAGNEGMRITSVDGEKKFGSLKIDAVLEDGKMSAFTNPALTNFQEYDTSFNNERLEPVVLHSLSITHTKNIDGSVDVTVNYNDGHIEDDFRMTGNIYLPIAEDIVLDLGKELLLNRSKTPSRITPLNLSYPDYTSPTSFIADDGGTLTLEEFSTVVLDEGTTMIYEGGSGLNMKGASKIYIRNGSLLCFKLGAQVSIDPLAEIIVEDGMLQIDPSITIPPSNITYTGDYFSSVQVVQNLDYCTVNSPEHIHSRNSTQVSGSACLSGSVVLSPSDHVKLTSDIAVEINSEFEVPVGARFEAEIYSLADDCNIEFFFGSDPPTNGPVGGVKTNEEPKPENIPELEVAVFPNPADGSFEVRFKSLQHSIFYELYDFSGNRIQTGTETDIEGFRLDNRGFPAGIYVLQLATENGRAVRKIVIR